MNRQLELEYDFLGEGFGESGRFVIEVQLNSRGPRTTVLVHPVRVEPGLDLEASYPRILSRIYRRYFRQIPADCLEWHVGYPESGSGRSGKPVSIALKWDGERFYQPHVPGLRRNPARFGALPATAETA